MRQERVRRQFGRWTLWKSSLSRLSAVTLNSSSCPSRDQSSLFSFFSAPVVHAQGKAKHNEAKENRTELVTPHPPSLPFCSKVPVVPSAYLRPVNSTQPSLREDLGSNKRPDPRGRQGYGRFGADGRGNANHRHPVSSRHPAPAMSLLFLPFPSFTVVPLCLCILFFFAPFVLVFSPFNSSFLTCPTASSLCLSVFFLLFSSSFLSFPYFFPCLLHQFHSLQLFPLFFPFSPVLLSF